MIESKQTFCMIVKMPIDDHPTKYLHPIWQTNIGSTKNLVCI